MKFQLLLFTLILSVALSSCGDSKRFFEANKDIATANWYQDSVITYEFEIEDTSTSYHLYYNIRNSLDYPYYNLYVQYQLSDSVRVIKSEQNEVYLFDPRTGEPSGDGGFFGSGSFGDVFDHQYPFLINNKFPHPGTYKINVQQYMRNEDPLKEIMSVGLRIEKAK